MRMTVKSTIIRSMSHWNIPSPNCLATEFSCVNGASWAATIEELATAAATNRYLVKDFMVVKSVSWIYYWNMTRCGVEGEVHVGTLLVWGKQYFGENTRPRKKRVM